MHQFFMSRFSLDQGPKAVDHVKNVDFYSY